MGPIRCLGFALLRRFGDKAVRTVKASASPAAVRTIVGYEGHPTSPSGSSGNLALAEGSDGLALRSSANEKRFAERSRVVRAGIEPATWGL